MLTGLQVYNMFHRQYMHKMLLDCATQEEGEGLPIQMAVNHKVNGAEYLRLS